MSHEIETHGTQAAAVFARKDAWHRLGTTVRDLLSRDSGQLSPRTGLGQAYPPFLPLLCRSGGVGRCLERSAPSGRR